MSLITEQTLMHGLTKLGDQIDAMKAAHEEVLRRLADRVGLSSEDPQLAHEIEGMLDRREESANRLLEALERVGCQDKGSCGKDEPDGLCFVCRAIDKEVNG